MYQPDLLRLMDANLNRVCEGLRVLEDFFRFAVVLPEFASRSKALRHRLRHEPQRLAPDLSAKLRAHRDVASDCGIKISRQLQDQGEQCIQHAMVRDYVVANCKRIQESLRSLEEASRMLAQPHLAAFFESQRYLAYELEADGLENDVIRSIAESRPGCSSVRLDTPAKELAGHLRGLYGMACPDQETGKSAEESGLELLKAGVTVLQYRNKSADTCDQLAECRKLAIACHDRGAILIVNDRIDIALASDADGVHLGQEDLPVPVARHLATQCRPGQPFWIGLSTHNPDQARAAVASGCDYIGVGPVFATFTKPDLRVPVTGLEYIRWAVAAIPLPQVAIGGIDLGNFSQVVTAGARCCAMIQAVNCHPDTTAAARHVHREILALI